MIQDLGATGMMHIFAYEPCVKAAWKRDTRGMIQDLGATLHAAPSRRQRHLTSCQSRNPKDIEAKHMTIPFMKNLRRCMIKKNVPSGFAFGILIMSIMILLAAFSDAVEPAENNLSQSPEATDVSIEDQGIAADEPPDAGLFDQSEPDGDDGLRTDGPDISQDLSIPKMADSPDEPANPDNSIQAVGSDGVTEEEAQAALTEAAGDIEQMRVSGLGTFYVSDLLYEARDAFQGENITKLRQRAQMMGDADPALSLEMYMIIDKAMARGGKIGENYTLVMEKATAIRQAKEDAYRILDELEMLRLGLEDVQKTGENINLTRANSTYASARSEFADERYEQAGILIGQAYEEIDDAIIESSRINAMLKASRRNVIYFIRTNFRMVIISIIILAYLGFIIQNEIAIIRMKKKLEELDIEKQVMDTLRRKSEESYYIHKNIPKSLFEIKRGRFKDKILKLREDKPLQESLLENVRKRRRWYLSYRHARH